MGKTWNWLIGKKKIEVVYPLDPEVIKKDKYIQALQKAIQSRDAQLAQYLAEQREIKENSLKEDKEQVLIEKLNEKESEIRKNRFGQTIDLLKLFDYLSKNKDKIEIIDSSGSSVFGKFGSILMLEGGFIGITDSYNNMLSYGRSLNSIFFKPDAIANQIKRNMICIPKDKNGKQAINFDDIEMPVFFKIKLDEERRVTQEATRKLKEQFDNFNEQLRTSKDHAEAMENANLELQSRVDDLERLNKVLENSNNTSKSRLSEVLDKSMNIEIAFGEMQNKILQLTEQNAMKEKVISNYESAYDKALNKIEELGGATEREIISDEWKSNMEWAKANIAENNIVMPEHEETKLQMANPGVPLK